MKRRFVCLANSKKYGERCIAGIELTEGKERKYEIVRKDGKPKWMRPVTKDAHGAVPFYLVDNIKLLDVVEIEVTEEAPDGYQCENCLFDLRSVKKTDTIQPRKESLDKLCDNDQKVLFGNEERKVNTDVAKTLSHSLIFIKPDYAEIVMSEFHKEQYRMRFIYNHNHLDLPITDISFIQLLDKRNNTSLEEMGAKVKYITLSLGIEFEKYHYKLVAGVIPECVEKIC